MLRKIYFKLPLHKNNLRFLHNNFQNSNEYSLESTFSQFIVSSSMVFFISSIIWGFESHHQKNLMKQYCDEQYFKLLQICRDNK